MRNKKTYILSTAALLTLGFNHALAVEVSAEECNVNTTDYCETSDNNWNNVGNIYELSTGEQIANQTYIVDYKQNQSTNNGDTRTIRVDYKTEKYDSKGHIVQTQDYDYDENGVYIAKVVKDYRYNPVTSKMVLSRTREYENGVVTNDVKVATTWEVKDIKKKVTGTRKQKNGSYIEDYKEISISNFGDEKSKRINYLVEKFDKNGHLSAKEDWDYDQNGKFIGSKVENYRYNQEAKKDVLSRTRLYENGVVVSDKKVATTWKNKGVKKFTTGKAKQKNGTFIEDFKNLKVSNFGEKKWCRTDYKIYKYNDKSEVISKEDRSYNSKGEYTGRVINNYRYNPVTKKNVITRSRTYDSKKVISDKKTATSWKNDGAKKKYTKGKKKSVNGTYIEEYKQKQVSNFGQKRTIRVDYKVWKYNKYKHVIQEQNYDYDKNGVYTKKTIYDCYYDSMAKKQVNTRIRTYTKNKKTSDLRKNQLKRPTRKGTVTNEFNGLDLTYSSGHKGIDIAAPTGTGIYPVIGGKIIEISYDRVGGNKVVVQHRINGIDYVTYYGHMSKLTRNYKVGDIVDVNDKIGTMGSSGLATGPHVHFELMVGTNKKDHTKAVNPRTYIDFPKLWQSY